jgi:enoyl-[acyl-carrier-protein] reductase (NADH)
MLKPLEKKVVLLFQDTRSGGWSLAESLARLGADVAVVYQHSDAEKARDTKRRIETEQRKCLILPVRVLDKASSTEAVRQTIEVLGRLDLFIDFSSPKEKIDESKEGVLQAIDLDENNKQSPLVHLEMLSAALYQMIDMDETIRQSVQE